MRNLIILVLVLGVLGLVIGYLVFGRYALGNELIPIGRLFSIGDPEVFGAVRDAAGFAAKRQNIFISGGIGVVVGVVLSLILNRRR